MRIYLGDNGERLYDRCTIQWLIGTNKSKVHREIRRLNDKVEVAHKNQFLYDEDTLFRLMERELVNRLSKMEGTVNGL